uniref:Essential protein Yae1 N-terminal domain-containing protein n=1 Tax=Crocodylus porosus TaxID=8502 RepID=A0A7M4EZI3_CROPO
MSLPQISRGWVQLGQGPWTPRQITSSHSLSSSFSKQTYLSQGYRDGVEAGKEHALQQGFNQGYREGAKMMRTCGQFKGILK